MKRGPKTRNILDRFNEKWTPVSETGCWLWTAHLDYQGYGRIKVEGKVRFAHRVAYELLVGPIPLNLPLDHLCRVRCCVNPAHLEAVTMRENLMRGNTINAINAAKTHCPQGHPYNEENTYLSKAGGRSCRTCIRARRSKSHNKALTNDMENE